MSKQKPTKNLCIRIHPDIHKEAKLFAYKHGFTLQALVEWVLTDAIDKTEMDWIKRLQEIKK